MITHKTINLTWSILKRLCRTQCDAYDRKIFCISTDICYPPYKYLSLAAHRWVIEHKTIEPKGIDVWAFQVYNIAVELDADTFIDLVPPSQRITSYSAFRAAAKTRFKIPSGC